jgi:toxin ParE1/3/4
MNRRIVIRDAAARDLDEHAVYLAEKNLDVALRFSEKVEATFAFLLQFPLVGRQKNYRNPALAGLRMRPTQDFKKYLIFYQPTEEGIEIVRVLYSSRDIDRIFEKEME